MLSMRYHIANTYTYTVPILMVVGLSWGSGWQGGQESRLGQSFASSLDASQVGVPSTVVHPQCLTMSLN